LFLSLLFLFVYLIEVIGFYDTILHLMRFTNCPERIFSLFINCFVCLVIFYFATLYFIFRYQCSRVNKILGTGHYQTIDQNGQLSDNYLMGRLTLKELRRKDIIFVGPAKK